MIQKSALFSCAEVARATGGEPSGDLGTTFAGVSTDTRDELQGSLFVALGGDRFDAHDFLGTAVERGARGLLVTMAGLERARAKGFAAPAGVAIVTVGDTLRALGDLARAHRRRMPARVVGLTGSNGKTSTKEMLAAILGASRARSGAVLKTEGNLNNLIGVPMTLFGLEPKHQVAVVEMGMNTKGEIARYAEIAEPELGLVVNVGPAHIGFFGSLQAIAEAKGELYRGLDPARGVAVVNASDPEVVRVARASGVATQRTFGWSEGSDVSILGCEATFDEATATAGSRAKLRVDGRVIEIEVPFAGRHNVTNAAAAIAAATAPLGDGYAASLEEVVRGLPAAKSVGRRMSFEKVGPYLLVDDCYNANSASVKAGLETVSARAHALKRRFVAVLGEMRELGDLAPAEHRLVGEAVVEAKASVVAVLGEAARPLADAASSLGASRISVGYEATDADGLGTWLVGQLEPGDVILVKGSRGLHMERFVDRIRAHAGREVLG